MFKKKLQKYNKRMRMFMKSVHVDLITNTLIENYWYLLNKT